MKCQTCGIDEVVWSWQPFGPDSATTFTLPGSHYRGFPVVKVCDHCKQLIQKGIPTEFTHKGQRYIAGQSEIVPVPEYVEDALLYWETRPT